MSEAELIKRCIKKDKKAWGVFVDKYSRLIYWAIRKRLALSSCQYDEADIEDIFQEVFLMVLADEKLGQLKDPGFIPGWLAMMASNKTADFMRKKVCRRQNLVVDMPFFKDNTFEQALLSQDVIFAVKEAINTLSDKERIIISLNLFEEKTHKEIADILRMPANSVSTTISRTKEKLKDKLKKRGVGENF